MTDQARLRVLHIAEAANPDWVSVPLVGWSNARALAEVTDSHLVTQIRNREAIVRAGLVEGRDFTAIDSEAVAAPLYRIAAKLQGGVGKGWTTLQAFSAFANYHFEHLVWKTFRDRIRGGEFQVVHRLTPVSPTAPSTLAGHCRRAGVPFVMGPLNGGLPWPREFDRERREEREWLSYVRGLYKLMPSRGAAIRDATALLIASMSTWAEIPRRHHEKCFYIPENAIDPTRFPRVRTRRATRPIRVVFAGRLVPYKGADMLLEAAAPLVRDGLVIVDVVGDGPQMAKLKDVVTNEAIADGVNLHGQVEHHHVGEFLLNADLFVFPSIREFGGAVVLEAMAVGLVPVVVNYGGPAELASERTGYLIELGDREQIVERLRALLIRLANDPAQLDAKSAPALRRARSHFTWASKADQIIEVYRWVLGQRPDPPVLPMPVPDEIAADSAPELGSIDLGSTSKTHHRDLPEAVNMKS
jgi:glycosyltransferase involved in cell wall biosynthesis